MPDISKLLGLSFDAVDVEKLTAWPPQMIEDYLSIRDNFIMIMGAMDEFLAAAVPLVGVDKSAEDVVQTLMQANQTLEVRITTLETEINAGLASVLSGKSLDDIVQLLTPSPMPDVSQPEISEYNDNFSGYFIEELNKKVVGPTSSTDNAVVRFDGVTGRLIQNSNVIIDDDDNVGVDISTPTARLHLPAGTTAAGTAALKLTGGALLTTQEPGTFAYSGGKLYFTNVANRKVIDRTSDVALSTVTVVSTATETTLWTGPMVANALRAGNLFKFHADGIISNGGATAADQITLRIKVGAVTVATLAPVTKSIPIGSHWHIDANATQRTIGTTGQRAVHIDLVIDDNEATVLGVTTIDTTADMTVTITAQWASAAADNTISMYQAYMEYKN